MMMINPIFLVPVTPQSKTQAKKNTHRLNQVCSYLQPLQRKRSMRRSIYFILLWVFGDVFMQGILLFDQMSGLLGVHISKQLIYFGLWSDFRPF